MLGRVRSSSREGGVRGGRRHSQVMESLQVRGAAASVVEECTLGGEQAALECEGAGAG